MKKAPIAGTQSLKRGLDILNLLSAHHREGLRLTEISRTLKLDTSTTHRLLACLQNEHFAEKAATTRRYHLGLSAMQLALESTQKLPLVERYRPIMLKLARISGDTVFLMVRQGDYAICLHIEQGDFPVKITSTVVGGSRALGLGAGGNAILAALRDSEIEQIYQRNPKAYEAENLRLDQLMASIEQTRQLGYSKTIDIITKGISAVGALIPLGERPFAAISIGSISSRMNDKRCNELGALLLGSLQQNQAQQHGDNDQQNKNQQEH